MRLRMELDKKQQKAIIKTFEKAPEKIHGALVKILEDSVFFTQGRINNSLLEFKKPTYRTERSFSEHITETVFRIPSTLEATIAPTTWYAPYVYFGVGSRRPNKFMDRIFEDSYDRWGEIIDRGIDDLIKEL